MLKILLINVKISILSYNLWTIAILVICLVYMQSERIPKQLMSYIEEEQGPLEA